jgi:hypothetical protein
MAVELLDRDAGMRDDDRDHELTPLRIGTSDHRGLDHRISTGRHIPRVIVNHPTDGWDEAASLEEAAASGPEVVHRRNASSAARDSGAEVAVTWAWASSSSASTIVSW